MAEPLFTLSGIFNIHEIQLIPKETEEIIEKHENIEASDLYPIKEFIQHLKFQKVLERYDDSYSMDMFGESTGGHKYKTPYYAVKMINPNSKEDMELLSQLPWITGNFDVDDNE